ncbi:MAG: FAD:protein FMN transferase [Gemmatimonadota bacterium]
MTIATAPLLNLATAAMGTRFELVLSGDDDIALRAAGESAVAEIERLHSLLTRFRGDSLLSHINRTAAHAPVRLDADTFALFQDAQAVYRESAGAFDVTLGTGMRQIVLNAEMHTLRFSDARSAIRDPQSAIRDPTPAIRDPQSAIRNPRSGMPCLDLGAIAKGHALDCAGRILRDHGVNSALLHGGTSSVLAIGSAPGEPAWRVALAHHPYRLIVDLCDAALSVSCTLGDRTHNVGHIVDPRTLTCIERECYAAATGPSARLADAWTTALVVLAERPAALGSEWTTWLW